MVLPKKHSERRAGADSEAGPDARDARLKRHGQTRSGRNIPRAHRFWRPPPGSAPLRLGIPMLCPARAFRLKTHGRPGSGIGSGCAAPATVSVPASAPAPTLPLDPGMGLRKPQSERACGIAGSAGGYGRLWKIHQ